MRALKKKIGKNFKKNLEQTCMVSGCLVVIPIYQDGTDLSR